MVYIEPAGILSDTIHYFVYYFNEDKIIQQKKTSSNDSNFEMKYYNIIKSQNIEISTMLEPFFYFDEKTKSFMNFIYHIKFVNSNKCNIEGLNEYLKNIENLKDLFIEHYFENAPSDKKSILLEGENTKEIYLILNNSELLRNIFFDLSFIILNFEESIQILIENIHKVYPYIIKLRNDNILVINMLKRSILSEENKEAIVNRFVLTVDNLDEVFYAIELINSAHVLVTPEKKFLFLGFNYLYHIKRNLLYENISLSSASKVFDETKCQILEMFFEKEEITVNEISEKLKITPPAVHKHMNQFSEQMVVYTRRRYKNVLYFSLNFDYFDAFKNRFEEYIKKFKRGNKP